MDRIEAGSPSWSDYLVKLGYAIVMSRELDLLTQVAFLDRPKLAEERSWEMPKRPRRRAPSPFRICRRLIPADAHCVPSWVSK